MHSNTPFTSTMAENLLNGLMDDLGHLLVLKDLLNDQIKNLENHDLANLNSTVQLQTPVVDLLQQNQSKRAELLKSADLKLNLDNLEHIFNQFPNYKDQFHQTLTSIKALKGELHEKLFLNYALIQKGKSQVYKILSLLTGESKTMLYNTEALTYSTSSVGSLTKA